MSTTKTITLSMQSLNKLYFQFFEKFVNPNLIKTVQEINQLLRNRTAYDVYKYLEELFSRTQSNQGSVSNNINSSLNSSVNNNIGNSINSSGNLYQYAIPTNGDTKSTHTQHIKSYDKALEKSIEDSISFKNKLGVRRTMTGLAYQETQKGFQFRNYNNEDNPTPSIYTNPLPIISNDYKIDYAKDPLPTMPVLNTNMGKLDFGFDDPQPKSKIMKDIVRKIGRVFNENHSKIEKYIKNTSQRNKIFNINTSTRIEKKQQHEKVKSYQFNTKDLQTRKY